MERTIEHIRDKAGSQFDPQCVLAFDKALPAILEIMEADRRESQLTEPATCSPIHAGCSQSAALYNSCRQAIEKARTEKDRAAA